MGSKLAMVMAMVMVSVLVMILNYDHNTISRARLSHEKGAKVVSRAILTVVLAGAPEVMEMEMAERVIVEMADGDDGDGCKSDSSYQDSILLCKTLQLGATNHTSDGDDTFITWLVARMKTTPVMDISCR